MLKFNYLEITDCDDNFIHLSMAKEEMISNEVVATKIYFVRGQKVMVDRDLAELYGVETRILKQAVRRNIKRFPKDFMFEMTKEEFEDWRSQIVMSKSDLKGLRYTPFCFTEHGVLMLSSVLNSDQALAVNIQIMRVFTKMREMLTTNTELLLKMEKMEKKVSNQDKDIKAIFQYLKQFLKQEQKPRKEIGFKK